jgi:hypothetical protein
MSVFGRTWPAAVHQPNDECTPKGKAAVGAYSAAICRGAGGGVARSAASCA